MNPLEWGLALSFMVCAAAGADALDDALAQAKTHRFGESRAVLVALDRAVKDGLGSPDATRANAGKLAAALGGDGTLEFRDQICRLLAIIGGPDEVPALSALLANEETSNMARYALEAMTCPEAADALIAVLDQAVVPVSIRAGAANSLGMRREARAAKQLEGLAAGGDAALADASIAALGRIGEVKALERVKKAVPSDRKRAVSDAQLVAADQCAASDPRTARRVYRSLRSSREPEAIQRAARAGLDRLKGKARS